MKKKPVFSKAKSVVRPVIITKPVCPECAMNVPPHAKLCAFCGCCFSDDERTKLREANSRFQEREGEKATLELDSVYQSGRSFGWWLVVCGVFFGFSWLLFGIVWLIAGIVGTPRAQRYAEGMTDVLFYLFKKVIGLCIALNIIIVAILAIWFFYSRPAAVSHERQERIAGYVRALVIAEDEKKLTAELEPYLAAGIINRVSFSNNDVIKNYPLKLEQIGATRSEIDEASSSFRSSSDYRSKISEISGAFEKSKQYALGVLRNNPAMAERILRQQKQGK